MKCTKNNYVHVQPRFCCHCQHGFLKLPNNGQTQGLVSRIHFLQFSFPMAFLPQNFFSPFVVQEFSFGNSPTSPASEKKWSTLSTWNKMCYTSMTYYFLGFAKIVMRNNAIEIIVCFIEKLFIDFKAWYAKRSNLQFTLSECTQCRPMVLDSYLLAHILDL